MLFNPKIQTKINDLAKREAGSQKSDDALEQLAKLIRGLTARIEVLEERLAAEKFATGARLRK